MDHPEKIGDYKILEFLGSGGMSVVYHAYDIKMDREIAVKMLKTENFTEQMALRFHREAKAASHLQHQNIIRIYDFGLSEENQPYMVLEYLKGTALDTYIKKNAPLDVEESIDLITQITNGMIHAHKSNVIHRDLKPSNIMLADSPSDKTALAIILDFGIAKVTEITDKTLTRTGLVVGSPNYMSPEQARGEDVDGRSDIYSIGCILFEMMTGVQPFRGDTFLTTLSNQINNPAPRLSEVSKYDFDDNIERIITMCLAKKASQRYQSMEELKEALENCLKATSEEAESSEISTPSYAMASDFEKKQVSFNWIPLLAITCIAGITFLIFNRISDMNTEDVSSIKKQENPSVIDESKGHNFSVKPNEGPKGFLVIPDGFTGSKLADLKKYAPLDNIKLWSLSTEFKNSDLQYLDPLKLDLLALPYSKVDDQGIATIAKRSSLRSLVINYNDRITDSGLSALTAIPDLEIVSVSGSKNITDEGIKTIAKIKNLTCVDVRECPYVTGKCLDYLIEAKNLRCLLFKRNKLQKSDLTKIGELKNLQFLSLTEMNISDSDLDLLPADMQLIGIDLQMNKGITNKSMKKLTKFQSLQYADVRLCKVTNDEDLETVIDKRHRRGTVLYESNDQHKELTAYYSSVKGVSLYYIPELYEDYTEFFRKCFARKAVQEMKKFLPGEDLDMIDF